MICKDCAAAARMLKQRRGDQSDQALLDRVASMHWLCPGGTWCDCAHVVPA